MTDNVYAPPKSQVADREEEGGDFYVVSKKKFLILFIGTVGIYIWFWFYQNWHQYRKATGESVWPVPRALFAIFFTHSLFRRVEEKLSRENRKAVWEHGSLATIIVILLIISNGLDRAAYRELGSPYTDFLSLAMLIPLALAFLKAQEVINFACHDANGEGNSEISALNYVWVILGVVLWLLILLGLYDTVYGVGA